MSQVAELKRDRHLVVLGRGALIRSLRRAGLIDEYILTIHPLVLGTGRTLFPSGFPPTTLTLVSAVPTTTGVIAAIFRPT